MTKQLDISTLMDAVPEMVNRYFKPVTMRADSVSEGNSTKFTFLTNTESIDQETLRKLAVLIKNEYEENLVSVLNETINGFVYVPGIDYLMPVKEAQTITVMIRLK